MNEIITSLKRTPYQTSAAFMVLFFTLLLSGILFISLSFLHGLLHFVETRPQVIVYFQSKTTETDIFKVRDNLMSSGKVESTKYVNKQEAFNIYRNLNKDNPLLLEMTSPDVLPASLEVYAKHPSYLSEIADSLRKQPGVDEVQFQKAIVNKLLNLTSIVRQTAFALFAYLIFMSIVVLTATTSFKIALKKEEIEVLQLLGASNYYIKKPFLGEGFVLGLSAASLAFAILGGLLFTFNSVLQSYLRGIPGLSLSFSTVSVQVWPFNPLFLLITFAMTAFFGVTIALIASSFATDRYLK